MTRICSVESESFIDSNNSNIILGFDLTNIYQSRETSPRMMHNVDALLECKSHLTDMVSMVGCSWLILSSVVCLEEECQRI